MYCQVKYSWGSGSKKRVDKFNGPQIGSTLSMIIFGSKRKKN